jgi:protein TonB
MGYQALLFCPDEKTARTVTQVLSELEFAVIPCTEPFAAVKQLMGNHFDAIVVDCDNEQNATLLFKSAHNATLNQSSLAVAVVEGQAGVAKAFRIGANLVLSKPINVEQAKGTLRVARGLLRKGEAAKPMLAVGPASKPASPVPASFVSASSPAVAQRSVPSVSVPLPAPPVAPLAAAAAMASVPARKPVEQPIVAASVSSSSAESDSDIFEISEEIPAAPLTPPAQISAPNIISAAASPATPEPKTAQTADKPVSSIGFATGAASAPAPAREANPNAYGKDAPAQDILELDPLAVEATAIDTAASAKESSPPATAFTLGGNLSKADAARDKKKKAFLAVAVVVLLAAVAYAVWMQWEASSGAATGSARLVPQPTTGPKAVPHPAPSAAPTTALAPSSSISFAPTAGRSSTPDSGPARPATAAAKPSPDKPGTATTQAASGRAPKANPDAADQVPVSKATARPIVIKRGVEASTELARNLDVPPSIAGIAGSGGAMPSLMGGAASAPTPVLQTATISQGVSEGLLVKKVQPVYPANALRLRLEGPVKLMATISQSGNISAVKILSGEPQLARAAVDAVRQWKYQPYLLNGSPVEVQTPVTVKFSLP